MAYRLSNERSRHCSCRVTALLWPLALPGAWAQTPTAAPVSVVNKPTVTAEHAVAAKPAEKSAAPAKAPEKKIQLYVGKAQELLSDGQWQTLVATLPPPESEPVSDSRDWSTNGPVVEVKGEVAAPEVPDGVGGLFWAIRHPTKAWRIFAPSPTSP